MKSLVIDLEGSCPVVHVILFALTVFGHWILLCRGSSYLPPLVVPDSPNRGFFLIPDSTSYPPSPQSCCYNVTSISSFLYINTILKMHGVFMRRVLLLLVVLYVLYSLKRTHLRWQRVVAAYSDYMPTSQKPARKAIKEPFPFKNVSIQHVLAFHEGHLRSEKVMDTDPRASVHEGTILSKSSVPDALLGFTRCPLPASKYVGYIRLPNLLYNISMSPASAIMQDHRDFWNPTIFALPYWAKNQYIIVNMVVAGQSQAYRQNVLCEANICHPKSQKSGALREKTCTEDDLRVLGPNGGLRCVTSSIEVDVPPTLAEKCEGPEQKLADIPGFRDPRLFYTARGEPILMVVSQYVTTPSNDSFL